MILSDRVFFCSRQQQVQQMQFQEHLRAVRETHLSLQTLGSRAQLRSCAMHPVAAPPVSPVSLSPASEWGRGALEELEEEDLVLLKVL